MTKGIYHFTIQSTRIAIQTHTLREMSEEELKDAILQAGEDLARGFECGRIRGTEDVAWSTAPISTSAMVYELRKRIGGEDKEVTTLAAYILAEQYKFAFDIFMEMTDAEFSNSAYVKKVVHEAYNIVEGTE